MRYLIILALLMPCMAHAMGPTQFGTYSQEYLDRQKCKADAKAAGKSEQACKKRRR